MRRIRKLTSNFLVCILCMTTFITQIHMVSAEETEDIPTEEIVQETTPETSEVQEVQDVPQTTEKLDEYYKDGKILIYNYEQLKQIGSDAFVYTKDKDGDIGTGDIVVNDGTQLTYGKDAQYLLMNEIKMDTKSIWNVKDDFTGKIEGEEIKEDETPTLYDKKTDTIYIYNPYQLMVLEQEDSDKEPVMSLDYDAPQFGMGQMIYPNGEDKDYLTYSKDHNYVISKNFSSDKPELVADQLSINPATTDTEGRDFKGQVVKTIGDKTYILIGNEEQLRAIGTDKAVQGAVYQAYLELGKWKIDKDSSGNSIMLYGGDADLTKEQNGIKDFTFGEVSDTDKKLSSGSSFHTRGKCGVDQKTGKVDPNLDIEKQTNQKYTKNANYIIFRDIDLSGSNWTPLTFQGTMIGAKSAEKGGLWKDGVLNTADKPVLSNVTVDQSTKINVGEQMGAGFFSTISSEVSEKDIGLSKGLVKVSNIQFDNLTVHTTTNETYYPETLVSALTKTLGTLLGGLLSGLTFILTFGQVKIDLGKTLGDVLDARKKDPTALSTGAIAGRVEGQVEISNIEVNNANVKNVNGYTGGFVGYAVGSTQYDGLSNALGDLVKLLTNILNVIPGLGLGDLIKILLGNAIPLGKLIPTGYINPKIVNCNVNGLTISTASDKEYAGGFIGMQKGAIVESCSVTGGTNTISGKNFVGGFVGLARDDVIKGTLSGALDIETKLPKMNTESLLLNCSLNNAVQSVSGESYIGGFTGGMANASTVNCSITSNALTVTASGNYAGGFAGIASLGWAADLGKGDTKDDLLGGVVDLVVKLLSSNPGATSSLLSLAGVNPSHILGCSVNTSLTVSGKDYVGGITGRGNGAYIAQSNADNLQKISYWKNNVYDVGSVSVLGVSLTGLSNIKGNDYVGGIAGSMGTASVAGLLNTTLGVASYLAFTVDNVYISGNDLRIEGNERVGGGLGDALGGSIKAVKIDNLNSVEGNNYVGGFIGLSGPGDLAGTDGGLTVNLLGLNYVLKLNNLLSLGQAIEVKIDDVNVNGTTDGFTVHAKGSRDSNSVLDYSASGFIAKSGSTKVENSHVTNLKSVKAADDGGYASGFVAISKTGGLAEVADDNSIKSLIEANGLVNAIGYLIPKYTNCTVSFVNGGSVTADVAGGFAADFQSGTVDNSSRGENDYYAVYNLDSVNGQSYAGGFGGNVYSGALADAGKGISVLGNINGLNINIGELLNLVNAYVPIIKYAGVKSDNGFTVSANKIKSDDTNSGSAGGFIGYGSGVQVSHCDVTNLKHTKVTPPKDLEGEDSSNYFSQESTYAVTGARYAGGYIGYMNIGSAASVGKGLSVLGKTIGLNDVLDALNVVVSTIEHSNVTGGPGGFAVKASMKNTASDASADDVLGDAGGFAGKISGGHIQNSNSYNFSYIIGQITAGGYVGDLQPGSVADALGGTSILGGLVNTKETLASLAQDFVPTIRNSSTTCIPCGGAVRADASSTTTTQRGMAGGYAGHNEGGHIWGNNTYKWKGQDYTGPISTCKAVRIRSVFGEEIAGGFTGLMESADTAKAGSLSLLWGLVKVDNILGALSVVYPTEENTAVYGPLALMDLDTWNSWVEYVGKYGGYGSDFSNLVQSGKINTQEDLDKILGQYVYGYNVVAGRTNYRDETILSNGGAAGGYVGSMLTGTITNGLAHDTKLVKGLRCAGGFAGEMINGGAANLGGTSILGLKLELGQMLKVLNVFVPVIKQSSVEGYQSGLNVQSTGVNDDKELLGYAGGYVGKLIGGQIWGDDTLRCKVTKLRRVSGTSYVGGFVGSSRPGSVATVDPVRGEGLLSKLLGTLLNTPTDLIKVLNATVATIRYADVDAWNDWGVIVNGAYDGGGKNTSYAKAVGGFAGMLEGTVLGKKDEDLAGVTAQNIRSVVAGEYAGGCFGISDVAGVTNISAGSETSLLDKLLKLGRADVLDAFRSYVYNGNVSGSKDAGLSVNANVANKYGQNNEVTYSGTAGGFGGSLLNGSVKNSTVTNLSNVRGLNSVGGFVGYSGKSGVVGADKIDVLGDNTGQLLGGALGVMDIFGSHIDDSKVTGINGGYTVQSTGGEEQIAGGFIGYANLARISNCTSGAEDTSFGLKQVTSDGTAGGFAGRTSYAYLADVKLDSGPANVLFAVVNRLVKALYLDKIENSNLLKINLGLIKVDALYDGNLIHVNILGLDISVGLSKKSKDNDQQTDLAIITIGDSSIKLPCDENGLLNDNDAKSNISVNLIKANRTKITDSKVYGISSGYDVYAGGADNNKDGNAEDGRSGGFVGFNDEGLLKNNDMYLCDVVRGTSKMVGPFSGQSDLNSVYEFNTQEKVEGVSNNYRIYRKLDKALNEIKKNTTKLNMAYSKDASTGWNIYTLGHMKPVEKYDDLQNAQITDSNGSAKVDLNAYESDAKAVLMADIKTDLNTGESDTPEPSESQDPCDENIKLTINKVWKDLNNFSGIRPKSITVTISRTWTAADNSKHTETVSGYESYEIKGDANKSTWKEVIKGLPAYKTDEDGKTIHYYKYSVTEAKIDGYTTTIGTSNDGFTFTITNKHFPGLPDTGGNGRYLIYLIGLLLLAIYLVTGKKRNKKNQLAEKL